MSDDSTKSEGGHEATFAELMEAYHGGRDEKIRMGDKISGKIISIGRDAVFVDTGTKVDGVVEKAELLDESGNLPYQVGDSLDLYVVSHKGDEVRLSRGIPRGAGAQALRGAFEKSVPVEGRVKGLIKGGFQVEMMKRRAFCPMGQMAMGFTEHPEEHVGKVYPFLITQFEEGGRNIVVSRKELLRAEQAKEREAFLKGVTPGAEFNGRITKLMPYGVFVELFPGVEGMVHISELSWSRVAKPEDIVRKDDVIRVKVVGAEGNGEKRSPRISLSAKQVTADPWESVEERYHSGARVRGRVTRCTPFGAFVELEPGIEGLVHLSEMSYTKRVTRAEEIAGPGDEVQVSIKEMDPARRRIALSIKDAEGDPWVEVERKFPAGMVVKGVIERKERFGLLVNLEPGITGLVPKSSMGERGAAGLFERLRQGDTVDVVIEAVHPAERRITLGLSDSSEEADWRPFTAGRGKALGSLGEHLQNAMSMKKGDTDK